MTQRNQAVGGRAQRVRSSSPHTVVGDPTAGLPPAAKASARASLINEWMREKQEAAIAPPKARVAMPHGKPLPAKKATATKPIAKKPAPHKAASAFAHLAKGARR